MYDVLIVGGGPAGLTAGIYAARAGRQALILERESVGGQIVSSPMVENYPGVAHVSGADLAALLYDQAMALGVELSSEDVISAEPVSGGFRLTTDLGVREGRTLILATGVRHRSLGLEGEAELEGCGVSYCAVCDGAFYEGRDVAVVGGGDTAMQDALFLSNTCRSVTVLVRSDRFRGEIKRLEQLTERSNVAIRYNTGVEAYRVQDGVLTGLELNDIVTGEKSLLPADGVFLAVGQAPCAEIFDALGKRDAAGYFITDESCATGVAGVFAAGDCRRKTVRQVTTAAADGAVAALGACALLDAM